MDCSASILKTLSVLIVVEVATKAEERFTAEFIKITDEEPHGYRPIENKWDCESRIYFNGSATDVSNLGMLGYKIETYEKKSAYRRRWQNEGYQYRITSNELFWKLVRNGFRIGETAPAA